MNLAIASATLFWTLTTSVSTSNGFSIVSGVGNRVSCYNNNNNNDCNKSGNWGGSIMTTTTKLSGSIYGNVAPEDEDGAERDHLGMKKPKSTAKSTKVKDGDATSVVTDAEVVEGSTSKKKVSVKFINFESVGGTNRIVEVDEGTNILKVAREQANVKIPYNCRSGLCGSCTADVKDPTWEEGDRPGFQTVRTCQAGAMLPAGCDEMVIDCYRMVDLEVQTAADNTGTNPTVSSSPMSNFEEGWEDEFSPDYKSGGEVRVARKLTPEYAVRQGRRSAIEIEKPHWTPSIDSNVAPWETIW